MTNANTCSHYNFHGKHDDYCKRPPGLTYLSYLKWTSCAYLNCALKHTLKRWQIGCFEEVHLASAQFLRHISAILGNWTTHVNLLGFPQTGHPSIAHGNAWSNSLIGQLILRKTPRLAKRVSQFVCAMLSLSLMRLRSKTEVVKVHAVTVCLSA